MNSPRRIENPAQGDAATFLELSSETGGRYSLMEAEVAPHGKGPPPHFHTQFDEEIEVVRGTVEVVIAGRAQQLRTGERVTIPRGTTHSWGNPTNEPLTIRGRNTPGSVGFENFLRVVYGHARDGKLGSNGLPASLAAMALAIRWSDTNLPGFGAKLFSPVIGWLARRAERDGTADELRRTYACEVPPLTLFQMPRAWGLPNPSPFCVKVETFLRMSGIPYETAVGDPRRGPKGKLPWIEDGETRLGDSGLILQYLSVRYGADLDRDLTQDQRAKGHLVRRMLEESLYWCSTYANWVEDDGWKHVRAVFERQLPPLLRTLVPPLIRRNVIGLLHAQGTGRHSPEEVYALGRADLDALEVLLGQNHYFLGASPATVDAVAYAFLGAIIEPDVMTSPLRSHALTKEGLVAYCARMRQRYFSEMREVPPSSSTS
ncbi:MAG: glutathione S-transferase C-terminal domain-containing protein [Pseudomonadota bacterium]|nr:glutathione S-transferase C-terminal domain-containing protein [Pseudomonadota bacterium]